MLRLGTKCRLHRVQYSVTAWCCDTAT